MLETVLEVKDLNVWYRGGTGLRKRRTQVLHDVSFTLYRSEILGLVGESGSGKSTLARAILGMESDMTGTVTHHTKRPQMVFQDPAGSLNPSFTVARTLAEPLHIYGKYDKAGIERRVRDTMALAGDLSQASLRRLADLANLHPVIVDARRTRDGHLPPRTAARLQTPFSPPSPSTPFACFADNRLASAANRLTFLFILCLLRTSPLCLILSLWLTTVWLPLRTGQSSFVYFVSFVDSFFVLF